MARLGGRGRHNGANAIVHLAREVVGRRRTLQNATQEVRNAVILDALSDEDFRALDTTIAERSTSDREFAQTLARLSFAAARAKGFDRCVVDAALRLDSLIPVDDPAHERDRLLRDAYASAQKASYIRGGRLALGRLGRRAVEAEDLERARVLLLQQLDLGPEKDDTPAEVDSALVLGDILRRDGEDDLAQTYYRRAASAADRLEYRQGVAEALVRQIDTTPSGNPETVAMLQHQALDAAQRTGDRALEARILIGLADTLSGNDRVQDSIPYYREALSFAEETGDLTLHARCVTALARAYRSSGQVEEAIDAERDALAIEERLGNRAAAASWALSIGKDELALRNVEAAVDAFDRARMLGEELGDAGIQQRAEGSLGIAHTLLGNGPETIDHLHRAIELARQADDREQEARWVASLGQAYRMFGQFDDAIRVTNDAVSLAEANEDLGMQAEAFTLLGQIYAARRETIRSRDCFTRALQINRDLGQTGDQVTTLTALAALAAETGQFTQATQLFDQALGLAMATDDRATAAVLHGRIGSLAQKRGDHRAAVNAYQRAADLAQTLGDRMLTSRSLQHLATMQDILGVTDAITSYERAVNAADEAGDVRGGITMRLNMGLLISRLPEDGVAEDAIGWLGDAANYAMEAGPEYIELRKRAEDAIQTLGGSPPLPRRADRWDSVLSQDDDDAWDPEDGAPDRTVDPFAEGSDDRDDRYPARRQGDPMTALPDDEWSDDDGYDERRDDRGLGYAGEEREPAPRGRATYGPRRGDRNAGYAADPRGEAPDSFDDRSAGPDPRTADDYGDDEAYEGPVADRYATLTLDDAQRDYETSRSRPGDRDLRYPDQSRDDRYAVDTDPVYGDPYGDAYDGPPRRRGPDAGDRSRRSDRQTGGRESLDRPGRLEPARTQGRPAVNTGRPYEESSYDNRYDDPYEHAYVERTDDRWDDRDPRGSEREGNGTRRESGRRTYQSRGLDDEPSEPARAPRSRASANGAAYFGRSGPRADHVLGPDGSTF